MNTNLDTIKRFKNAPWLNKKVNIILIGLGGIGSHTSLLIYKTIPLNYFYLIDKDVYELHNVSTQLTLPQHIGLSKSYASKLILTTFNSGINSSYSVDYLVEDITIDHKIKSLITDYKYTKYMPLIIISAVDSMEVRKYIYNTVIQTLETVEVRKSIHDLKKIEEMNTLLIDGRLNATSYELFAINPYNEKETFAYEKSLLKDSEVPDGVCTMRQTFHFGSMIGSKIVQIITNWLSNLENKNKENPIELYKVPFFVQEIGDGFIFKTMTADEYLDKMNHFK